MNVPIRNFCSIMIFYITELGDSWLVTECIIFRTAVFKYYPDDKGRSNGEFATFITE